MNIIIVGCGKVGQTLTEKLSHEENQNITVVDLKSSIVNELANLYDVMGVTGSGASIDTLEEAGIKNADMLIAVTDSDELNLLTCLIAKKTGNCSTVARVRKPEYNKEVHFFKEDLGLAMVINPEQTAANEIARILSFPSAIQIDTFAKGRVEILKFRISDNSLLDNMRVSELAPRLGCDILVCGVERGEEAFIPGGEFVLKSGDYISIVASVANAAFFFDKIGINNRSAKDTMIVGGGNTAYYLANKLIQNGISVKIIEQDPARCDELCTLIPKAIIVNADGTESRVLVEEGLENAESFVSLTNIDEENILLSMFAKSRMKSGKVITKINRITYGKVIGELDLDTIIYPKNITAEYIIRLVRATQKSLGCNIETMHNVIGGKAEALEFRISEDSPVINSTIEELNIKKDVIIACIIRRGVVITPRGKDMIMAGDTVIVVTTCSGFMDINDILE